MDIIQQLHGMQGKLSTSNSAILTSILKQPTASLWRSARNIVICDQPLITVNAAVRAVTRGQVAIAEIPDTFTLYRAFRYAREKRKQWFQRMEVCDTES